MEKVKAGLIGCGTISGIYLDFIKKFPLLDMQACGDLDENRARETAEKYGIPKACSVSELLEDPQISVVLNLTIPPAHYEITRRALEQGKHVYGEKPLALRRKEGKELLELAEKKGLLLGCAPDTFLGAGLQTARKVLDQGRIGEPLGAAAFMMSSGPESWHPDPEFYYQTGGGPLFDMGPYYLTALIHLLGPVKRVAGSTRMSFPQRRITSPKKYGKLIPVEVPTYTAGTLDFVSGAVVSLITTFDAAASCLPPIEIYGSQGSLLVPDPNTFGGPLKIKCREDEDWRDIPLTFDYQDNSRGLGLADMVFAIREGRSPRAGGSLACHVLDIILAVHESSNQGKHVSLSTSCSRPAPLSREHPLSREGEVLL